MHTKQDILGSLGLTNNHALLVWSIDELEEKVVVSVNFNKKHRLKLNQTNKGYYFTLQGTRYYLSEFLRHY